MRPLHPSVALTLTLALLAAPPAGAQTHEPARLFVPYAADTGRLEAGEMEVLARFDVVVEDALWLRLHFARLELGGGPLDPERGVVRITSLRDGAVQTLDAQGARQWSNTSAYFNGDALLVELLAGPAAGPCRVALDRIEVGIPEQFQISICDVTDDRVPSSDPRAARLLPVGCTGWLIDDCYRMFLTAGHCTGNLQVAQFNVPASSPGGSLNHPPPQHQYAIDASSLQTQGGAGVGLDWAYFGAFPNAQTGLTASKAQGAFYQLENPPTAPGTTMRITGYGTAPGSLNQTQQTSTGPLTSLSGTTLRYRSDTTGGNSGSPVIRHDSDRAVGIHTHGGCGDGTGSNHGTSILLSALQQALGNPLGICDTPLLLLSAPPASFEPEVPVSLVGRWIADPVPGSAFLRYRTDGGAFQQLPLVELGNGLVQIDLPAASCGDSPEWYVELVDAACGTKRLPAGAPSVTFAAPVGELEIVHDDDMELDLGWSTEVLGATSGWWQRGVPVNDPSWAYGPVSDADGSGRCWLTQNEPGNTDVDDGAVRLTSYALALPDAPATLSYAYFLRMTNPGGVDRLLVEVRVEPAGPWTELIRHEQDGGLAWHTQSFGPLELAAAGVPQGATIRLRFTANDANPQSIVEAGVDALRVEAVTCDDGVGTNVCMSGANGAVISANGSASVAANDFTLHAEGLPASANGIFFHGSVLAATPFGNGFLCVAPATVCRLFPILNSGAEGRFSMALDLADQPPSTCAIGAGSTLYFQAWFRDGGSFDLTDALTVEFTP